MKAPEPYLVWRDADPHAGGEAPVTLDGRGVCTWIRNGALLMLVLIVLPPTPYLLSPLWLLAIATGYAAALLIGVVMLLPLRRLLMWPNTRISVARHKRLAELALAMTVLHTVLFLVTDGLTIEYLMPSQPRYMVAGNVGLLLLIFLVVTSLERVRVMLFGPRFRFRPIHVTLSILLVVLLVAHMAGSAIYIASPLKAGLYALIGTGLVAVTLKRPRERTEGSIPSSIHE